MSTHPTAPKHEMLEPEELQRAEEIIKSGERTAIPISEKNAQLAAKWGDLLGPAVDVVRAIDYQAHEPANVFNPVVLDKGSKQ